MDLRTYLEQNGIDRREFAMRVGTSKESIDNYVKRKNRPRPFTAAVIEYITEGLVTQRELTHPFEYPVAWEGDHSDLIPQAYRLCQEQYALTEEEKNRFFRYDLTR